MERSIAVAYCAGFLDADGCVNVVNKKNTPPNVAYPCVTVGQRVEPPLRLFEATFGGRVWQEQSIRQWFWRLNGLKAGPALQELVPLLIVKRPQADLALEWIDLGLAEGVPGRRGYSLEVRIKRAKILNEICRLNGRGTVVVPNGR